MRFLLLSLLISFDLMSLTKREADQEKNAGSVLRHSKKSVRTSRKRRAAGSSKNPSGFFSSSNLALLNSSEFEEVRQDFENEKSRRLFEEILMDFFSSSWFLRTSRNSKFEEVRQDFEKEKSRRLFEES